MPGEPTTEERVCEWKVGLELLVVGHFDKKAKEFYSKVLRGLRVFTHQHIAFVKL